MITPIAELHFLRSIVLALIILSCLCPAQPRAAEVELQLRMMGQGYQTRTAAGELLDRRRISQWAGLRAGQLFELQGLDLQVDFRFDTDFGNSQNPWSGAAGAELLAAQLRYRTKGRSVSIIAGRQMLWDEVDFVQFDGLRLELALPWHLHLRLFTGLQVRQRTWMGNDLLELDGVEKPLVPAPVVGSGLWFRMAGWAIGLDYRRVSLWRDGWPLLDERLAAWTALRFLDRHVGVDAGATYSLALDKLERARAGIWGRLPWFGRGLRLELAFLSSRPLYSLDSIFNFFSPAPFWQVEVAARQDLEQAFHLRLAGFHRGYRAQEKGLLGDFGIPGKEVDGIDLSLGWTPAPQARLWLLLAYEDGAAGQRWLVAPSVRWTALSRLDLHGRLLILDSRDSLNERLSALTMGGSAGLSWSFGQGQALHLVGELNGNKVHPLRTRILVLLDLAFGFGRKGRS